MRKRRTDGVGKSKYDALQIRDFLEHLFEEVRVAQHEQQGHSFHKEMSEGFAKLV